MQAKGPLSDKGLIMNLQHKNFMSNKGLRGLLRASSQEKRASNMSVSPPSHNPRA